MKILLGSQSPRRRSLLAGLDIAFECVDIHAKEDFPSHLQAGDIPLYIAQEKADAYLPQLKEDELLITADTIVWVEGCMLGKPHSLDEAKEMLHLLSGKTHQVYTAVVFTYIGGKDTQATPAAISNAKICVSENTRVSPAANETFSESFMDCTDVVFRTLTDEEIDYYVEKYRPLDKAGAYGVQEYIGYIGVEKIVGSYYNVMGLPIAKVYTQLQKYL